MAGDERRAEVEAARTSWVCDACGWSATFDEPMTTVYCVACLHEGLGRDVRCRLTFPLDRVRDARGDDEDTVLLRGRLVDPEREAVREVLYQACEALWFTRDYVGEATLPAIKGWSWYDATVAINRFLAEFEIARSPQGEDHERLCDDETLVQRAARALARCSPPALDLPWDDLPTADRAPYEDAAIAVLMELGDALSRVSPSRDGTVAVEALRKIAAIRPPCSAHGLQQIARDALAQFARSATGEQTDHGGDQ